MHHHEHSLDMVLGGLVMAGGSSAQEMLLRTLVMNVSTSAQLLHLDAAPDFPGFSVPAAVPVSDTAQVSTLQRPLKNTP